MLVRLGKMDGRRDYPDLQPAPSGPAGKSGHWTIIWAGMADHPDKTSQTDQNPPGHEGAQTPAPIGRPTIGNFRGPAAAQVARVSSPDRRYAVPGYVGGDATDDDVQVRRKAPCAVPG